MEGVAGVSRGRDSDLAHEWRVWQVFHGDGTQIWFDKCFTIIAFSDGCVGGVTRTLVGDVTRT